MTTTTFGIGGMFCASCVACNERTLLGLPRVRKASVNCHRERARNHNPGCGTSRNTLAMIRASGEEPTVIEYLKTPPSLNSFRS